MLVFLWEQTPVTFQCYTETADTCSQFLWLARSVFVQCYIAASLDNFEDSVFNQSL